MFLARLSLLAFLVGVHATEECTDETTLLQIQSELKSKENLVQSVEGELSAEQEPSAEDHEEVAGDDIADLAFNAHELLTLLEETVESTMDDAFLELQEASANEELTASAFNKVLDAVNTAATLARRVADQAVDQAERPPAVQAENADLLQKEQSEQQRCGSRRRHWGCGEYRRRHYPSVSFRRRYR